MSSDICCLIFGFLAAPQLGIIRAVCRAWNRIAQAQRLWLPPLRQLVRACNLTALVQTTGAALPESLPALLRSGRRLRARQSANYLRAFKMTPYMRSVLVQWVIEVHQELRLEHSVLFVAVAILDRFLIRVEPYKRRLQLVGACALWIANSRHDATSASSLATATTIDAKIIAYFTAETYTAKEAEEMRQVMIFVLGDWPAAAPSAAIATALDHLDSALLPTAAIADANKRLRALALFWLEMSLLHVACAQQAPQKAAVTAVCLARACALANGGDGDGGGEMTKSVCRALRRKAYHTIPALVKFAIGVDPNTNAAVHIKYHAAVSFPNLLRVANCCGFLK